MPPVLTDEQEAILALATCPEPPSAVLISAGPGTGKTFIIEQLVKRLPRRETPLVRALAFNREIATELVRRLPPAVLCSTFNSFGLECWSGYVHPKPCHLNPKKTRGILRAVAEMDRWSIAPEEVDDLLDLVSMAKNQGYAPPKSGTKGIAGAPEFKALCALADVRPEPHYQGLLDEILRRSIAAAFQGDIDFDDQVYMTTLFVPTLPSPKWLLVDEAQDLNGLQLALVARLKAQHTILVGDPLQAIYAFRGAMSDSFDRIRARWPSAIEMPLNISFRLPQGVVTLLQTHNPCLTTAKADEGVVIRCPPQSFTMEAAYEAPKRLGMSCAVLCRNNAPLFKAALACLAASIPFAMNNVAFGRGLVRDIKRLGGHPDFFLVPRLKALWDRPDLTPGERERMEDKLAALDALAAECHSTGELVSKIESLLRQPNKSDAQGYILLSTAHRAKGLEFDWVMHLDPHLIPSRFAKTPEEISQEQNIAYVINSRTKHTLVFCRSDQILIPSPVPRRMRPDIRKDQPL